jgi:RES domain
VIPDGRQHIEYTPTQVLTEYLRWMPENRIDGIARPSAQTGEKTHVLFFDSKAFADADRDPPGRPASFRPSRQPIEHQPFAVPWPSVGFASHAGHDGQAGSYPL